MNIIIIMEIQPSSLNKRKRDFGWSPVSRVLKLKNRKIKSQ